MCDCYRIGGPFIAEDPDCPVHGTAAKGREDQVREILIRVWSREISADEGTDLIMELD